VKQHSNSQRGSLEIDDDGIRLAVATPTDGGYVVHGRCTPLPAGAVESGHVVSAEPVAETIKKANSLLERPLKEVALVLSGRQTICRVAPLNGGQDRAAVSKIEERMRRYVLFGGQPVIVSHLIQRGTAEHAPGPQVLAAATLREVVLSQVEAAERCGLHVASAEPGMVALARAVSARNGDRAPCFLLLLHSTSSELGILHQDGLVFCQWLRVGADAMTEDGAVLVANVTQLQEHHLRHGAGREPIERLLCCGRARNPETFFERLATAGVEATWLDPVEFSGLARLEGEDMDTAAKRAALAPVVAGTLPSLEERATPGRLDLLPRSPAEKRGLLYAPWLVVPVVLVLLTAAGLATANWLVRRELTELTLRLNNPTAEMLECSRLQLRESELRQRRANVERLLMTVPKTAVAAFIAELPRRLPDAAWLERVSVETDGRCAIGGWAQTEDAVFAFADSLRHSPHVDTVRMGQTSAEQRSALSVTRFGLDITLMAISEATGAIAQK